MADGFKRGEFGDSRIALGLLQSVERDGRMSQRRLASELDIALGLVNLYLKRFVKKGLIKMTEAPARRYAYYLTPKGFAEKSRLTVHYITQSFSYFRSARADCTAVLEAANAKGWTRIALAGKSDLAEIAIICALECGVEIVAVVDAAATGTRFIGRPLLSSFTRIAEPCDAAILTDLRNSFDTLASATAHFGEERVLVPAILSGRVESGRGLRP
jgi:DNA-binding MarR family transcriptional regulator